MKRSTFLRVAIGAPVLGVVSLMIGSEISLARAQSSSAESRLGRYLSAVGVQAEANAMRKALAGIFDQLGHERRALRGTVTAGDKSSPFVFTRELDQRVRLDLVGGTMRSTAVDGLFSLGAAQSRSFGGAFDGVDHDILEVLAEDSAEALLYSFGTTAKVRWLGDHYRTDDSTDAGYAGPLYDVFAVRGVAATQPDAPARAKIFLFDSATKLLSSTRYEIKRNGSVTQVEVAFSNWVAMEGQMAPATIVRQENGQRVFEISVSSAQSTATQADSLFNVGGN